MIRKIFDVLTIIIGTLLIGVWCLGETFFYIKALVDYFIK